MIVPSQLALTTYTNFGCAVNFTTLDKLPLLAPPIGDTSLTHIIRLRHIQPRHQCQLR
jgi:hypothetical protein